MTQPTRLSSLRRWWGARCFVPLVLACNALTGVNDLEVRDPVQTSPESLDPAALAGDAGLPCDALTGSGCPEGQTCRPSPRAQPSCVPLPAVERPPYATCSSDAECPVAHACVTGVCSKLCSVDTDCGGVRCVAGAAVTDTGFGHCAGNCDLAAVTGARLGLQACGPGARCEFTAEAGGSGFTDCVPAGNGIESGPCNGSSDCAPGLACFGGRCERVCDAEANGCPAGLSCSGRQVLADQEVGACCRIPEGDDCDVVTDCGCQIGQTCRWRPDGSTAICEDLAASPLPSGAICSESGECPQHHSCFAQACVRHCTTEAECSDIGGPCAAIFFNDAPTGRSVCPAPCNPLEPSVSKPPLQACGSEGNCRPVFPAEAPPFLVCGTAGPALEGDACQNPTDCSTGLVCRLNRCQRWCSTEENICSDDLVCQPLATIQGQPLGTCCERPPGDQCAWATDCGCSSEQTCVVDAGVVACRSVLASAQVPYGACGGDLECPRLHECNGSCMRRCSRPGDCGTEGLVCWGGDGNGGIIEASNPAAGEAFRGYCSRNCDVFSPQNAADGFEPCGPGTGCLPGVTDDGVAFISCTSSGVGTVPEGGDCTAEGCVAPLSCVDSVCRQVYCELGTTCAEGDCVENNPPFPVIAGRAVGVCPLPAAEEE